MLVCWAEFGWVAGWLAVQMCYIVLIGKGGFWAGLGLSAPEFVAWLGGLGQFALNRPRASFKQCSQPKSAPAISLTAQPLEQLEAKILHWPPGHGGRSAGCPGPEGENPVGSESTDAGGLFPSVDGEWSKAIHCLKEFPHKR